MLTFVALAQSKGLQFLAYESAAEGLLENVDGKYRITEVSVQPNLALQLRFLLTSESMGHHDSEDHGWREHRSRRRLSFGHRRYGM
ncbi:MAG: hypothetical protein ABSF87_16795, partial [Xanthobacteraceae bacterium]